MARMYPSQPSIYTNSYVEKLLFEEFQKKLENNYSVIHSKRWIDPERKGRVRKQGECDFIVLHPTRGILFIEAKPGEKFYCSGLDEHWYCEDGSYFRNPLNQASESQYALISLLEKKLKKIDLPYNIALAFPQAETIGDNLPDNIVPSMIILQPDLKKLQSRINEAISVIRKPLKHPIPSDEFKKIISVLRAEFKITTSLSSSLKRLNQQFFQLEKDQITILNLFESNKRVIVEGCAGSGKTLIATEKAHRMAEQGKNVLLLCFNIPLAEQLRKRMREIGANVDVFNFHGLCEHVVKNAGGEFKIDQNNIDLFWDETCAELLDDFIPKFEKRYDCIIVDEAQDFIEEWWVPISRLLANENDSEFYIFMDPAQNIFGRNSALPFDGFRLKLDTNYRNTLAITNWLNKVCDANIKASDKIDKGIEPVEIKVKNDDGEREQVHTTINQLIKKEKLDPSQIVLLGKHPLKNSVFKDQQNIGKFKIIETPIVNGHKNGIRYSSIYRFKGLEADCVLFTGINSEPRSDIEEDLRSILLTGGSRAKMLLYLFTRK